MKTGQIQLGVKRSSGKSLDRFSTQGFFYGGGVEQRTDSSGAAGWNLYARDGKECPNYPSHCQHLILQTCGVAQSGRARDAEIRFKSYPVSFFYDNPSQKRVARCTNIPHTGALPTVKGVGQRLRKGFQGSGVANITLNCCCGKTQGLGLRPVNKIQQTIHSAYLESLSSAAEIRHSARNTRLRLKPSPDLNS